MYSHHPAGAAMAPPQKPETFMLSNEAQQSLPQDAQVALQQVDNLKYFLISAPVDWSPDQFLRRFLLPTGEYVSCVLWNNLFHISGTDIVRCLSFRFQAFGRPVRNSKKFEEGIFSDLRNLKAGTDASLEEPKSAFLDFLYKNNCIRTQKKQKVFYWYSVPHDRLFLDALERDLKREKMGQEATTVAVSEPAMSFEFDSSQSLFEQLTKAQQANSSSFSAHAGTSFSQSTSPVMRAIDSMPPPQMMPPSLPTVTEELTSLPAYGAMPLHHMNPPMNAPMKRDQDFTQYYDRNGIPLSRPHQRHASMPAYLEYSPAPSFVSSHHEDYSNRGISYEPITPPQQSLSHGAEPAYVANDETGLYSVIPDLSSVSGMHGMMQLPPSNLVGQQYVTAPRSFEPRSSFEAPNMYSVIEGSPTYKQRRRRSSISASVAAATAAAVAVTGSTAIPNAVHRPSDLRRSVSASVPPTTEDEEQERDSPPGLTHTMYPMSMSMPPQHQHHHMHQELVDVSRHGTPLPTLEGSPAPHPLSHVSHHDDRIAMSNTDILRARHYYDSPERGSAPGALRRARSATAMEVGPYPHKSHSCPIPTCGRLFKRLEHLKRHVRTHTQERPYVCPYCSKAFSRSDNLAQHRKTHEREEGTPDQHGSYNSEEDVEVEDHLGPLGEDSPDSDHAYLAGAMASITSMPMSMPMPMTSMGLPHNGMAAPSQLINAQQTMLQQSV